MKLVGQIEPKPGVYMIKNTINGKVYIGSTVNMRQRVRQHRHSFKKGHHNQLLDRAYKKYGTASFVFSVLEYCEKPDIRILEQNYIVKYNSLDKSVGYNLAGVTELGLPILSDEARERISIASKNRQSKRSAEEKLTWAKKIHEQRTKEERSAAARNGAKKQWENKTPEERVKLMRPISEAAWKKTRKKVVCSNGIVYESLSECSRQIGLSIVAIYRLIQRNGKSRKLNGLSFTWYQEASDVISS